MALYVNTLNYAEHVALWKGDVRGAEPVLVRMHAINVLDDVLGDGSSGKAGDLQQAMRMVGDRSEEHTSELQSLMRISYAVFCLKKKTKYTQKHADRGVS